MHVLSSKVYVCVLEDSKIVQCFLLPKKNQLKSRPITRLSSCIEKYSMLVFNKWQEDPCVGGEYRILKKFFQMERPSKFDTSPSNSFRLQKRGI